MTLLSFLVDIFKERNLVYQLAKKDLSSKYKGSGFGGLWAFIHPILLTLTYWFVFEIGFRSFPIDNVPFILWLLAGIVPWFFFAESLYTATYSIEQNSYLVKKVVFKVHLLPVVKVVSALFVHLIFIILTFLVFLLYGNSLDIYMLQIIYYIFSLVMLVTGLSWLTSALNVFLKDVGQIISVLLQFGFWLTPIFWPFSMAPEKFHLIFKLNPMFYIVQGFRDTFIDKIWFWEHYLQTSYFWLFTLFNLIVGSNLFKKLRPHFSDVL